MAIRLVVADDSFIIRDGLQLLLATQPDLNTVASVATLPELRAAVEEHEPDVVVTDIRMPPGNLDEGIQAAEWLAETRPQAGVVVLSQYVEPEWALRLFEPSAAGRAYLHKERVGDLAQLRHSIQAVADGGTVLDPQVVEALVRARVTREKSLLSRLTAREQEVLEAVASGKSNGAIAAALVLSERAVEKHISSILAKLELDPSDAEVHRRVRAVLLYLAESAG